jgi:segregation and condensation protein A
MNGSAPRENYAVNLDVFQGPLDLLLYLIKKEEIDIYDIPIARITSQYMQYIEMMKILNLDVAGEYILMAATLIRIKTRMLLPREEEEGEESDPREDLVAALLEYRKFKEAGEILREKRILEEGVYVPPAVNGNGRREKMVFSDTTTLYDLLTAFRDVVRRTEKEPSYEIVPEQANIVDRVERILKLLADNESATFIELFADVPLKLVAVTTFIAVLELTRIGRIIVRQSLPFSELRVYRGEQFYNPRPVIELFRKT